MLHDLSDIINRSMSNIWSQARSMRLGIYFTTNLIWNCLFVKSRNEIQIWLFQDTLDSLSDWTNSSWPNHHVMKTLKSLSTSSLTERGSLNVFAATRMEFCGSNLHSGFNESWALKINSWPGTSFQRFPFTRIVAKQIKTLSQTSGGLQEKETSLNVPQNTIHVNRVKASQL